MATSLHQLRSILVPWLVCSQYYQYSLTYWGHKQMMLHMPRAAICEVRITFTEFESFLNTKKNAHNPNSSILKRRVPPEDLDETVFSVNGRFKKIKSLNKGKTGRVFEATIEKGEFKGQHCAVKVAFGDDRGEKVVLKNEVAALRAVRGVEVGFPKLFYPDPTKTEPALGKSTLGNEIYEFFAMSLTGPDMTKLMAPFPKKSWITLQQAVQWVLQMIKAVQELHDKGYSHNDIKPYNVAITLNEQYDQITLIDFGDARKFDTTAKMTEVKCMRYSPYGDYCSLADQIAIIFGAYFWNEKILTDRFAEAMTGGKLDLYDAMQKELEAVVAVKPGTTYDNLAAMKADVGSRLVKALVGSDDKSKQTGLFNPEWNTLFPEAGKVSTAKAGKITSVRTIALGAISNITSAL